MASTELSSPPTLAWFVRRSARLFGEGAYRRLLCLAELVCLLFLAATTHAQSSGPSYVYDALGRLVAAYDASGNAAVYKYDAVGNLLSITNYSATQFASLELSSTSSIVGSTITVYGTDFCSSPSVTFNGSAATVVSTSPTQIVVTVPPGATTGPMLVTCGSNQANLGTFTVASNLPNISSFSPVLGASGTSVTISGTNFQPLPSNNQVIFNIAQAVVTSASGSSLTAKVPPSAMSGPVTVRTPYGQAVSSGIFVVPPPGANNPVYVGQATLGAPISVSLSSSQQGLVTFSGTAGQQISLAISQNTIDCPSVSIYNPDGSQLASTTTCGATGFIDATMLSQTGTYTILVPAGDAAGSMTLTLNDAPTQTGTISIGGPPVTVTAGVPGQDALLTFSGSASQQVSLAISQNTIYCPSVSIYNPDGSQLASTTTCGATGFIDSTTLPQTGSYTIFVDAGDSTGSMTLTVSSSAAQTGTISIGGPPVTVTAGVPGQDALLTFSATAGQQISLAISQNTIFCPSVSIYNPDGSQLASTTTCGATGFIDSTTLPQTGSYTIFVDVGDSIGSMTLMLNNAAIQTGTIAIGGPPVTVTASVPGQDTRLTFSGSAGQQTGLIISQNTIYCPSVSIYNPDGSQLASTTLCGATGSINNISLTQTGTYTILVDVDDSTGSMILQLWNLTDISSSVNTSDNYGQTILGDAPQMYWRLDESGPATAANAVPAFKYGVTGPTSPDSAVSLSGGASYIATTTESNNPTSYSVEIWFKTTTTGGKLIGFGNGRFGASSNYDRHIYMTDSGNLVFGQWTGSAATVASSSAYNDGQWHQVVGTYDGATMTLYVDGSQVGSTSAAAPQNYTGYWRIGYDNLSFWPSAPADFYFLGSLGEAAVYPSALSATQVSNHYAVASGGSYDSTILADNPTSYWKLNEPSGTLADSTGGGNTATPIVAANNGLYQGGISYSQPGAIAGDAAVSFDGSTALVESVLSPPIAGTNSSLEAWVYIPSSWTPASGSYGAIFQAGTNNGIGFGIGYNYPGTSGFHVIGLHEDVRGIQLSNDPQLSTNTWYHIVMVVDASGVPTFYINTTAYNQSSTGAAPNAPTGNIFVGDDPAAGGRFFGGTIDEPAVYSYPLTAMQVANHFLASGH